MRIEAEPASVALATEPSAPRQSDHFYICGPKDGLRREAERFVRESFQRTHGARIASVMPTLLTLTDAHGTIRGVCGYRPARAEPLFLERYLDEPFEQGLSRAIHKTVDRDLIVEVGNFACANARAAVSLVALLTGHLLAQQFLWAGFTATSSIRRILHLMGGRPLDLGPADASRVQDCPDFWGRYYSHQPRVMAGYLPKARRLPAFWSMHRAD